MGPTPARAVAQSGSKKYVIRKPEFVEVPSPHISKELKRRWSYFIRKVYETDPLVCPKCRGEMRIISFIGRPEVIIHTKRNSLAHELPSYETQLMRRLIASWSD